MKLRTYISPLLGLLCLLFFSISLNAQNKLSGTVEDNDGEPLIGANIVIKGTSDGTITDFDGAFELNTSASYPMTLVISYTGYNTTEVAVNSDAGKLSLTLSEGLFIDEVVVSASRKREKVQEAPASISVITARKLESSAQATDPARNLINEAGVQISQQGASRINIEMRGQSAIFSTSVFPIMDYRSLVGPGIGTFQPSNSGLSNLDLERIEVVRGPGSALYGPGVVAGVIHFITKNPIDNPGTSIELMGGELNTLGVGVRHAYASPSKKFGFKINAAYKKGDEFTLDPNDVDDAAQIAKFQKTVSEPGITNGVVDPTVPATLLLSEKDLDPDGDGNPMSNDWWNTTINATLEFRPQDDLSVFVSGGYNRAKEVFYNSQGEGLNQNAEYWTQARFQKGGLFGQVFYVNNDGGTRDRPTFLYQTGLRTVIAREQLEGQLQYNFELPALNADLTAGVDYRQAVSSTENLVYGRNENDDDYRIIGTYLQGKFALAKKLDLVLAARYDKFNFLDDGFIAPRVALVYKVNPRHTLRASYNRASNPQSALNVNIDFPVAVPVPGLFDVWLTGSKEPTTFTGGLIDITLPGVPDLPVATPGLPLAVPYGAVAGDVLAGLIPALAANPATAPLVPAIQAYFADPANAPAGFTGEFQGYNLFNGDPISLTNIPSAAGPQVSTVDVYEAGYKGLVANKLGVTCDIYYTKTTGFWEFTALGPTVRLANAMVADDLGAAVAAGITDYFINTVGLDEGTAAAVAAAIGGAFAQGGQAFDDAASPLYGIFGAVEADSAPQGDGVTHTSAGYRSFSDASFDYLGVDLGLQYYHSNDLSFFFNYSYISQNEWVPGADDDDGLPFRFTLSVPESKFRLGANYTPESGVRGSLAFQHDDEFFADFGQFSGTTDKKNLIDLSIGYKFDKGLAFDVSATNLTNSEYRAFPGFPKIGRRVIAKLTYKFGEK